MAHRKPLVQFETSDRAKIVKVSEDIEQKHTNKKTVVNYNRNIPRVVNGRLNIKIRGYSGIQKIPTSALIQYIPADKLREATIKVLVASGTKKKRNKKKGTTTQ